MLPLHSSARLDQGDNEIGRVVCDVACGLWRRDQVAARLGNDGGRLGEIRDRVQRFPFQPALKHLLIRRGVPIEGHSREPLRALMPNEKAELDRIADELLPVITR
jgi:hypothetical protein